MKAGKSLISASGNKNECRAGGVTISCLVTRFKTSARVPNWVNGQS
jgi:hypothetical protein